MRIQTLFLFLLAGCSTPPYMPPSGPTAKIRIIAIPPNNNTVTLGADPQCVSEKGPRVALLGVNANSTFNTRGASKKIGVPEPTNERPLQTTEFFISAGTPAVIESSAVTGTAAFLYYYFCKRAISFVPEADASYEVIYDFETDGRCKMEVSKFVATPSGGWDRVRVPDQIVAERSCRY